MVMQEVEPGVMVIATNYVQSLEDRSRIDHEKWMDAEVRALMAEEEAKRGWELLVRQAAAERTTPVEHPRTHDDRADLDMRWKQRFFMLCAAVLVVGWLVMGLLVVPHWYEITEWFTR